MRIAAKENKGLMSRIALCTAGAAAFVFAAMQISLANAVILDMQLANTGSLGSGFDIQVEVEVGDFDTGVTGNEAKFIISNPTGGTQADGGLARVLRIYFEDDLDNFLSFGSLSTISDPVAGGNPNNSGPKYDEGLSGLNPFNPPGITNWTGTAWGFDEASPYKGVRDGQSFTMIFDILRDNSGDDKVADTDALVTILQDPIGLNRLALHVADCENENSCALGSLTVVPLPAALPLYGTGLAVMGLLGWNRKRKAQGSA